MYAMNIHCNAYAATSLLRIPIPTHIIIIIDTHSHMNDEQLHSHTLKVSLQYVSDCEFCVYCCSKRTKNFDFVHFDSVALF